MGDILKTKLGIVLKKLVFAFGLLYGINVILSKVGIFLPINIITVATTTILGVPGLLSLYTILFIIN